MTIKLTKVCKFCGFYFGFHKYLGQLCPKYNKDLTRTGWFKTKKFKE